MKKKKKNSYQKFKNFRQQKCNKFRNFVKNKAVI